MCSRISIAMAVLVHDGLVLMVHRQPERAAYPERWALPGGHVEPGELPHDTVRRECVEEIGVHVHDPRPVPMAVADVTIQTTAFLVTRWTGEVVNAAPEEHDDLRWVSAGGLMQLELAHPETLPHLLSAIQIATDGPGVESPLPEAP